MPLEWDRQCITWFEDASLYTGFHRKLAALLAPDLQPEYTLCDLGCGVGSLSLELAKRVRGVTAIDLNREAVAALRAEAGRRGAGNLQVVYGDAARLAVPYDVILMSFFGKHSLPVQGLLPLCRHRLIRVLNATVEGHLYPKAYRRNHPAHQTALRQELDASGLPYDYFKATIEFGQPLRSRADAEAFVQYHAPAAPPEEVARFVAEKAQPTGRADFPLYLPNPKQMAIFVIGTEQEGR